MRPTVIQRQDVVYFRCLGQPAFLPALLAQRMLRKKPRTDLLPHTPIPSLRNRVAAISFILPNRLLLMFLAEPSFRQPWTAGIAAWPLRSHRHTHHLRGIEKPPEDTLLRGPLYILLFWHFNYITNPMCKSLQKRANFYDFPKVFTFLHLFAHCMYRCRFPS